MGVTSDKRQFKDPDTFHSITHCFTKPVALSKCGKDRTLREDYLGDCMGQIYKWPTAFPFTFHLPEHILMTISNCKGSCRMKSSFMSRKKKRLWIAFCWTDTLK